MSEAERTKFMEQLPLFIHLFFALIVVTGFIKLAEMYQWTTRPHFDYDQPSDVLVPLSFTFALFWIVTDWIAYNWLIVKHPYTPNFRRFIVDVAGFSLMFAVMNFSFLAGEGQPYHYFIFAMAGWHALIGAWHLVQKIWGENNGAGGARASDALGHGMRCLTYVLIGCAYYWVVALRLGEIYGEGSRIALIAATFAAILYQTCRIRP